MAGFETVVFYRRKDDDEPAVDLAVFSHWLRPASTSSCGTFRAHNFNARRGDKKRGSRASQCEFDPAKLCRRSLTSPTSIESDYLMNSTA